MPKQQSKRQTHRERAEISYCVRRQEDTETAEETINAIQSFEHIGILPVTGEIAEYGATLRDKYHQRGDCEFSYTDTIPLAMAAAVSECDTLYLSDPDFENVDGVTAVIL